MDSGDTWLEFSILSDSAVDITDLEISNGVDVQKISELEESLILISDSQILAGTSVHLNANGWMKISEQTLSPNFILPEDRLIFSAKNEEDLITFAVKSNPLSLAENKTFQIVNRDNVLAEVVFAKDLRMVVSEISPNNMKNDFFELFVKSADEFVDLQFLEVKHNGKRIFFAENSFLVQKDDILTFQLLFEKIQEKPKKYRNTTLLQETGDSWIWEKSAKNGIVASSGTMEIILWSGTSWEKNSDDDHETADFICWAKKNLNKTETKRLAQNMPQNWDGNCVSTPKLVKNESIARSEPQTDINSSFDFYRHFHGSPGERNFIKNQKPHARIKLQSGKFEGESRINFTGLEKDNSASVDSDGLDDLNKFQWKIDGKTCGDYQADGWEWVKSRENHRLCYLESQKSNPSYIYFNFDQQESFEISLKVTDLSGYSDTVVKVISREKIEDKIEKREFNYDVNLEKNGFFIDFLEQINLIRLKEIAYAKVQPDKIEPARQYLFARDRFSAEEKTRIAKNIGLIFQ